MGIQVLGIYAFQIGFESLTVCPLKKLESQKRTSHCCAEGVLVIFLGGFITWKCVCSMYNIRSSVLVTTYLLHHHHHCLQYWPKIMVVILEILYVKFSHQLLHNHHHTSIIIATISTSTHAWSSLSFTKMDHFYFPQQERLPMQRRGLTSLAMCKWLGLMGTKMLGQLLRMGQSCFHNQSTITLRYLAFQVCSCFFFCGRMLKPACLPTSSVWLYRLFGSRFITSGNVLWFLLFHSHLLGNYYYFFGKSLGQFFVVFINSGTLERITLEC